MLVWKRRVWRNAIAGLCVSAWAALVSGGCSEQTRYRVLSVFFEGVPKPGQKSEWQIARHQPRRPPPPVATPTPLPPAPPPKEEFPPDWLPALLKTLPQDSAGYVDLVAAVDGKLIAPRPGPAKDEKVQPVFNMDVKLIPKGKLQVTFSHRVHTTWLSCTSCHPKIFQMKAGADQISMALIWMGKFCGTCHGKVAFATDDNCSRCHVNLGKKEKVSKPKPLKTMAGEIHFKRAGSDPATKDIGPATFPHLPHRVAFRCYACHDRIFQMKHKPDPVTMAQISQGEFCGACHNGRTAFGASFSACTRCHQG